MERLDEPQRGGTPYDKVKRSRSSAAPTELLIFVSPVYPGFHIGLCPHSTLGFEEVSCLKALVISWNFDVVALFFVQLFWDISTVPTNFGEYTHLNL